MRIHFSSLAAVALVLTGCIGPDRTQVDPVLPPAGYTNRTPPASARGWAPVYDGEAQDSIGYETARTTSRTGKIFLLGNMLYQVDPGLGIHITSISDPANPQRIQFMSIPGCQEVAVSGTKLYSNFYNDLVVLDISRADTLPVLDRLYGAFQIYSTYNPPDTGWYECPDSKRGVVTGWRPATLSYPKCYRPQN